ncbi:MAG TPA: hypothetical protein VN915_15995 [Elusimicrobiota bacterium]|nr:hypothetical protein [Elusimicrobiota bacterium]
MKRTALSLLLALAGTANAALPRVSLETPVTPVSAPAYSAAPSAISAAPRLLGAAPSLSVAAPTAALPALSAAPGLTPAPALAAAPAVAPALAVPAISALPAAAVQDGPKAIDALKADAPLVEKLSAAKGAGEDSAAALQSRFDGAAADGPEPVLPLSGEAGKPADADHDPLLSNLLQHVRLDDGGVPERRAALMTAFRRMLKTPTARALAERFIADGVPAVVRFEAFEGSRLYDVNGRKIFYAPRAFTEWKGDHVELRMNLDYLGTHDEFQQQDLPPTLAHELLGHGLWYSRAARENALQAFHHHDLNETNARLVGWLVDFELDRRFEESGAWSYLADPAAFLNHLKLRLPYYALTWSTAELARPRETLEERSQAAKSKREQLRTQLANHSSWNAVIDHFVSHHAIPESKLVALRGYMAETAKSYQDEIGVMDALINEVDATIGRMNAEPDRASERYLQWAATHPLFADLRKEVDANTRRLQEQVSKTPAKLGDESVDAVKAREDHWRGQVTFEQLVEMYRKDREQNPKHWQS